MFFLNLYCILILFNLIYSLKKRSLNPIQPLMIIMFLPDSHHVPQMAIPMHVFPANPILRGAPDQLRHYTQRTVYGD